MEYKLTLCKDQLPEDDSDVWCYCEIWNWNHYTGYYKCMHFYREWEFCDGSILPCFIEHNVRDDMPENWAHPDIYNREHGVIHVVSWFKLPKYE